MADVTITLSATDANILLGVLTAQDSSQPPVQGVIDAVVAQIEEQTNSD